MNQKKLNFTAIIRETAVLTAAVAIIAAAVFFFLSPSHTSVSSISGLGIVLSNFIPLPLSAITMILNIVLLIIGFLTCGKEFGAKTVYTSVMLPVFLGLFELVFPDYTSMTGSQELDVLCYILVVSIGLSILFNRNASSGGLDIVAKILNKYLRMDLGRAMSLSGMCVALSAALVYDKKTVVLSILGTYFNGIILDHFIFDHNKKRRVCIITEKEEALRQFIINELHSGATIYEAIGAYNLQKHNEIITIVDKSEYQEATMLNHKGFDLWADGYDKSVGLSDEANTYPFAGYKKVLAAIFQTVMQTPNASVLDIGFGTAVLTARLYEQGCTIYGQDFSSRMLELASEKMPDAQLYQGDFTTGLVEPLRDRRYDYIVATYSLHHLTDAQKVVFLSALRGCLNENGKILIGDVAFETRGALNRCRQEAGADWDVDEIYFVAEELKRDFPDLSFTQLSPCAGVLTISK